MTDPAERRSVVWIAGDCGLLIVPLLIDAGIQLVAYWRWGWGSHDGLDMLYPRVGDDVVWVHYLEIAGGLAGGILANHAPSHPRTTWLRRLLMLASVVTIWRSIGRAMGGGG